jgi:hypothetical protein
MTTKTHPEHGDNPRNGFILVCMLLGLLIVGALGVAKHTQQSEVVFEAQEASVWIQIEERLPKVEEATHIYTSQHVLDLVKKETGKTLAQLTRLNVITKNIPITDEEGKEYYQVVFRKHGDTASSEGHDSSTDPTNHYIEDFILTLQ